MLLQASVLLPHGRSYSSSLDLRHACSSFIFNFSWPLFLPPDSTCFSPPQPCTESTSKLDGSSPQSIAHPPILSARGLDLPDSTGQVFALSLSQIRLGSLQTLIVAAHFRLQHNHLTPPYSYVQHLLSRHISSAQRSTAKRLSIIGLNTNGLRGSDLQ